MTTLNNMTKAQLLAFIQQSGSLKNTHCVNVTTKHVFSDEADALLFAKEQEEKSGYCVVRSGDFTETGGWNKGTQVEVVYKTS